jgi:hypothetical protein
VKARNRLRRFLTTCAVAAFVFPATAEPCAVQPPVRAHMDACPDLSAPAAILAAVWEHLPAEVKILPTENYLYWQLRHPRGLLRGNLRPATGQREKGLLNFGCEDTSGGTVRTAHGQLGAADGVLVQCRDHFTVDITFRGKAVRFLLHRLSQEPPPGIPHGERFIQRTHDESGCGFLLMFDTQRDHFFWVLDEQAPVPEKRRQLAPDILRGERTGFIFWQQPGRKVLAAVLRSSVEANDCCDGPFDQLADNYARETNLLPWLERAWPAHCGALDQYGYFTNRPGPKRIAVNCCLHAENEEEAIAFIQHAAQSPAPLQVISRGQR